MRSDADLGISLLDSFEGGPSISTPQKRLSVFPIHLSPVAESMAGPSRSTSDLESFQNCILMYASKRFSFSPPVYEARTILAALDYNHNKGRPHRINKAGETSRTKIFKKRSNRWNVHTLRMDKTYTYIPDLQRRILEVCHQGRVFREP